MESSSDDSFQWTDASNDSSDIRKNKIVNLMETKNEEESDSGSANCKKKVSNKNIGSVTNEESNKMQLKTKKRRCSEVMQESSDNSQPEKKRIKLEPDSDIDIGKKKIVKDKSIQGSILYDDEYLNLRVKQEQISRDKSKKKKKKKRSNSNVDNASHSNSTIEPSRASYLDLRVKEEQISVVEPEGIKSKKKKKHKRSTVTPDTDIPSDTKSVMTLSEVTVQDGSTTLDEPTEYSIIEEKFCAEETVVEKPRKKKRKTDVKANHNIDVNNELEDFKKMSGITSEIENDNLNNNDVSLEPNDFICNNIVSSTILNSTAIDLRDKQVQKSEQLLKKDKNLPRKISDRIRFEEDDNSSQQEPQQLGKESAKTNMFLKVNPQLNLYASETSQDSLITKDDEIWTLTWPHEVNLEKLRNTTVLSAGKCKIKIDGQSYEGVPNEDVNVITLLTHEHTQAYIKNIPVKEFLVYHKRIPKVHIPDNNIMVDNQRNFIPLPETKCRHPLFGARYKKAIKIPTAVVERLQAAKGRYSETPSENIKKKKHKKDKHKSVDIKTEDSVYIKPEHETLNLPSKNKKRKCSEENNGTPKKLKYVNQNADSPAVWESEKAIEENLFNF